MPRLLFYQFPLITTWFTERCIFAPWSLGKLLLQGYFQVCQQIRVRCVELQSCSFDDVSAMDDS